jgi:hypothetical protein
VLFSLFIILKAFSITRIISLLIIYKVSNIYYKIKNRLKRFEIITKVIIIVFLLIFLLPRIALLKLVLKRARILKC